MLATRIRQKDGIFYFVGYPAKDLLDKVRFISRFYGEGEQIAAAASPQDDDVAQFISRIERNDKAFQRALSRAKVARDQELLRNRGDAAADPGHGAAVHQREAAISSRSRRATASATWRSRAPSS